MYLLQIALAVILFAIVKTVSKGFGESHVNTELDRKAKTKLVMVWSGYFFTLRFVWFGIFLVTVINFIQCLS